MKRPRVMHYPGGTRGEEITPPDERPLVADDGMLAFPERVQAARRHWPEGRPEDFEKVARRRYVDRASGTAYRVVDGCPLFSVGGPTQEEVDCWFISADRLVFLERADKAQGRSVLHGPIISGEVVNGRLVRS